MSTDKRNGHDESIEGDVSFERDSTEHDGLAGTVRVRGDAAQLLRQAASGPRTVRLDRSASEPTPDQALWVTIRDRTRALDFDHYSRFIDAVLCEGAFNPDETTDPVRYRTRPHATGSPTVAQRRDDLLARPTIQGVDSYRLLKLATEAFLIFECGAFIGHDVFDDDDVARFEEEESRRLDRDVTVGELSGELTRYLVGFADSSTLPYLDRIVTKLVGFSTEQRTERLPYCQSMLRNRLTCPSLIELIWSYWQEEGMLVQTMNAIAMRFQNRGRGPRDPLVNLELDPLRPLNNLLWGFVQDESNRLSLRRRAYEYDHHYGFRLVGKALDGYQSADSRTKFVEGFHNLLYRTVMFYREDDDTTVIADAFALLNSLREVHLLLAEGAHNQYGDLPWTARREMLTMQWLLARPEIREFIRGRHMVPYQEPWMGAVDDMKRLQGWSDVTVTHFRELAVYGEQLLLSVRFGDWIDINDQDLAKNWARYWRPEVQRYIHAYQAVTGVDLAADISDIRFAAERTVQPSVLIRDRLPRRAAGKRTASGRLRAPADEPGSVMDAPASVAHKVLR